MRRFSGILIAALLMLVPAAAMAGSARQSEAPRAELDDLACVKALDPAGRAVSVTAVMRPLTGTQKLAVDTVLEEHLPGTPGWTDVAGPHLGVWLSPTDPSTLGQRPGDIWKVPHAVINLGAPAAYRFQVAFRWTGSHGRVIGTASRTSKVCLQPELRPDLTVDSVTVEPDPDHPKLRDDYLATISDTGATGAGPFTLELTAGDVVKDKTIPHIDAHTSRTVEFTGPICSADAPPTVTVDPTDQIDVYTRANATLAVSCPAPTASSPGAVVSA